MREQVMGEQDRLCPLEMCVAGEIGVARLAGTIEQDRLEVEDPGEDGPEFALGEETQVGGDLIIATPPGMELRPCRTGQFGDPSFDGRVDVLVRWHERERAVREFGLDTIESAQDVSTFVGGEDAGSFEPSHMGA